MITEVRGGGVVASPVAPGAVAVPAVVAFGSNNGAELFPFDGEDAAPGPLPPGPALFIAAGDVALVPLPVPTVGSGPPGETGGGICARSFSNPAVELVFPSLLVAFVAPAFCDARLASAPANPPALAAPWLRQ
jgi:hypothetical protein